VLFPVCIAAIVGLFYIRLMEADELRTQCNQMEDAVTCYERLMQEGDTFCESGEKHSGEQCYLTALQINRANPEPYLRLARIYREYRYYDLALWILKEYPGEAEGNPSKEIHAALEELESEMERLEVSQFQKVEE